MIRTRRLVAALVAAAAILGTGAAVAISAATSSTAPAAGPHRVALDLPVRPAPDPAPVDPLAALVADGAGDVESVTAAACMGDPAVLAASGWTPGQLAALPAIAAAHCPTDHDPAPVSFPANPCAWGVDRYEAAGLTEAQALARRTPCSRADAVRQAATAAAAASSSARRSTSTTTTAPAHVATAPEPAPAARPTTPARTTTDPGHTPPCGPGTAWDGTQCTAPQADAERIGRTVDTTDGRTCTLVAVDPDAWTCTRSQP